MTRVFESLDEFKAAVGEDLGSSDWLTVTQEMVNTFADATGDHQWIHVDVERANAGPFGQPIAHGYLTLSLLPALSKDIFQVEGIAMGVNYGADKLRFPSAVPVGSRVRAQATLKGTNDIAIGTQATIVFVIELEGSAKPACIAEAIYVYAAAKEA